MKIIYPFLFEPNLNPVDFGGSVLIKVTEGVLIIEINAEPIETSISKLVAMRQRKCWMNLAR